MQPHNSPRLRLAPSAHVMLRGPGVLQFGLDATRSGLIETPLADALEPILAQLHSPLPRTALNDKLRAAGMDAVAADSLIDDLISYRVLLVEATSPTILLVGDGLLHAELFTLLRSIGITVRSPIAAEPLRNTLAAVNPAIPAVFVDCRQRSIDIARLTKKRSGVTLPVDSVDARVFIGPIGQGRFGPCPYCAHLYHTQRDPQWAHVVSQSVSTHADPLTVTAGATAAALLIRRISGIPDPPGVSAPKPRRGEVVIVDPFGTAPVSHTTLPPHPDCSVCY